MFELEVFRLFLMVLARFSGLMVSAPILGSVNIPMMAKAGLSGLFAMLVTPVLPALAEPLPEAPVLLAGMAIGEFLIGLIIGFVMTITFAAIQIAGQIMDLQTGFGMMNIFNPAFEVQFPVFGFFLFIVAVLYLLVIDGHHMMIRALAATYEHIPVGGFVARPALFFEMSHWGTQIFIDGVMIAAPVAGATLLAFVTLGLLGRVIPQLHLFVIGFPITMSLGILMVALILGIYIEMLDGMFYRMFKQVETAIHGMS